MPPIDWINLRDVWDRAWQIAQARTGTHRQSKHYARDRFETDFVGVVGEWAWLRFAGSVEEPPANLSRVEQQRFVEVATRATDTLGDDVHLLVKPREDGGYHANYYILVQVDRQRHRARLMGWATLDEVKASRLQQFRTVCHAIHASELHTHWR